MLTTPSKINVAFAPTERKLKSQYTMLRQALTRPRHLVHKTKLRAKGRNTNPNSSPRSAEGKLSLSASLPTDRVGWSGKETSKPSPLSKELRWKGPPPPKTAFRP